MLTAWQSHLQLLFNASDSIDIHKASKRSADLLPKMSGILLMSFGWLYILSFLWRVWALHADNFNPPKRQFVNLPGAYNVMQSKSSPLLLRVLQFNVLADGLSGLRSDLGKFSRVGKDVLDWETRKPQILNEIVQYSPDIITLQECDHYYDYFFPELSNLGYSAFFAPKPTSACLEVSQSCDGCALFIRKSKLRVLSCEAKTLALSIAALKEGELQEEDESIKAQNQVGLMALCEFVHSTSHPNENPPPPLIVCTTHLKSAKSYSGERYRQKGLLQILDMVDSLYDALSERDATPLVLLTGDFNAEPYAVTYTEPLTYQSAKKHRLDLRSVYNDDTFLCERPLSCKQPYTTWKARRRGVSEEEVEVRRCIDYIFYCGYVAADKNRKTSLPLSVRQSSEVVVADSPKRVMVSFLLRSIVYMLLAVLPITSFAVEGTDIFEKFAVLFISTTGLVFFEHVAYGTIFRPEIPSDLSSDIDTSAAVPNGGLATKLAAIGKQLQQRSRGQDPRPGLQPTAILDVFEESMLQPHLIPSDKYPSDHIAIAADFQVLWDK